MTIDLEENRTANIDHLIDFGKEYGFEVLKYQFKNWTKFQ
jgi:hypothetical protein